MTKVFITDRVSFTFLLINFSKQLQLSKGVQQILKERSIGYLISNENSITLSNIPVREVEFYIELVNGNYEGIIK